MDSQLEHLFDKLGYNQENGLYILENSYLSIHQSFPHRISRILTDIIKPYAIYCHDNGFEDSKHISPINKPLILFYDNPSKEQYRKIARNSFNLSKSPIVIVADDILNKIDIFHGFSFSTSNPEWLKSIDINLDLLRLENLRSGKGWEYIYNNHFNKSKTVDQYLLSNITDARRILVAQEVNFPQGNLLPEIANRLIGRLIFIRYLIDRNVNFSGQVILKGENKSERQNSLNELLLKKEKLYDFFQYITDKFKGDLFPLEFVKSETQCFERDYVREENLEILYFLFTCSNIFAGKDIKGYSVQQSLFNKYDFEIIPVELISNIYESFLGSTIHAKAENLVIKLSKQQKVKAYYTPPYLVDHVLGQTVNRFLNGSDKVSCKVLDPACGSGIFLVETLRQLIEKEIQQSGERNENYEIPNQRLWQLLKENIFGIDIDANAIEITIFSLYITLLDYKRFPKEIEQFEFQAINGTNLFGGKGADFFNLENCFNKLFSESIKLDFIIGNPPWGQVKSSSYLSYIKKRNLSEKADNKELSISLEIGNNEISQAFMVRVSDFIQAGYRTQICFIVTSKNLYNSDKTSKNWRKYLLTKFRIIQSFDLTGINNKIAGGNQVFENAKQPPVILLYDSCKELITGNKIKLVVARANKYYNSFKTIVIDRSDVKLVSQQLIRKEDKLWKILLYGNSLDFQFIQRLTNSEDFVTCESVIEENNLEIKGGFKSKDSSVPKSKRKPTEEYWDFEYLEVNFLKEFGPFLAKGSIAFKEKLESLSSTGEIDSDLRVPQIPNIKFFKGKKLLLKKGLDASLEHRAVSAFTEKDCVFSSTVASIVSKSSQMNHLTEDTLYSMAAIFNSRFFTYFLLMTSSSFGTARNRANFTDFLNTPFRQSPRLSKLSRMMHDKKIALRNELIRDTKELEREIEDEIFNVFEVSKLEQSLIDYSLNVSLPVYKRAMRKPNVHISFLPISKKNIQPLIEYCQIFVDHFSDRFNQVSKTFLCDIYLDKDYLAINFKIGLKRTDIIRVVNDLSFQNVINRLGLLGTRKVRSDLFVRQDVRGFNKSSFYLIKPNELKNWMVSNAYNDLNEFVEAIAREELQKNRK